MKTVTIILPDEFVCCATTAVAWTVGKIATFTNCFNVSGKELQTVRIKKMDGDCGYELVEEEPPKEET